MDNIEQFLVALTDATIACNTCLNAALDMGLSTCTICGFRQNPEPVIKALNITGKRLPVIGLTIGYMAKKTPLRPKVDKTYKNTCDLNLIPNRLKEYDQIMSNITQVFLILTKITVKLMLNQFIL